MNLRLLPIAVQSIRSFRNLLMRQMARPLEIQQFNYEVTRRCNGCCLYCNIWETRDFSQELTIQELEDAMRPRTLFKSVNVVGVTGGEPFLRRDLVNLCAFLRDLCPNGRLGLVTNGLQPNLTLDKMIQIREIDPEVSIGVSLDGFGYVDNVQRANPEHCMLAWETIGNLQREGFNVGVGSVITPLNIHCMLDFKRFCRFKRVHHSVMTANTTSHFYSNAENPNLQNLAIPKNMVKLFEKVCNSGHVTSFSHYFPKYLRERRQILPCFSGFNSFFLSADGLVYPCIHLNESLGSIRDQSFGDIWFGEAASKIRRDIKNGSCHCYTLCEVSGWFKANILPAIAKVIERRIAA